MNDNVHVLLNKRKRTSKQRIPYAIPVDYTLVNINWSGILRDLRHSHDRHQQLLHIPRVLEGGIASIDVIDQSPATYTELTSIQPKFIATQRELANPIRLRRVLTCVKFTGLTDRIQGQLNLNIRRVRQFLTRASNQAISRWWQKLYRMLPEPYFFLLYTTFKALT